MGTGLKTDILKNNRELRIRLNGDLDPASLRTLIRMLRKSEPRTDRILVYTRDLQTAFRFGQAVMEGNLMGRRRNSVHILLAGEDNEPTASGGDAS